MTIISLILLSFNLVIYLIHRFFVLDQRNPIDIIQDQVRTMVQDSIPSVTITQTISLDNNLHQQYALSRDQSSYIQNTIKLEEFCQTDASISIIQVDNENKNKIDETIIKAAPWDYIVGDYVVKHIQKNNMTINEIIFITNGSVDYGYGDYAAEIQENLGSMFTVNGYSSGIIEIQCYIIPNVKWILKVINRVVYEGYPLKYVHQLVVMKKDGSSFELLRVCPDYTLLDIIQSIRDRKLITLSNQTQIQSVSELNSYDDIERKIIQEIINAAPWEYIVGDYVTKYILKDDTVTRKITFIGYETVIPAEFGDHAEVMQKKLGKLFIVRGFSSRTIDIRCILIPDKIWKIKVVNHFEYSRYNVNFAHQAIAMKKNRQDFSFFGVLMVDALQSIQSRKLQLIEKPIWPVKRSNNNAKYIATLRAYIISQDNFSKKLKDGWICDEGIDSIFKVNYMINSIAPKINVKGETECSVCKNVILCPNLECSRRCNPKSSACERCPSSKCLQCMEATCSICMENVPDICFGTQCCKKPFHLTCVIGYLMNQKDTVLSCPCCRGDIFGIGENMNP